MSTEHPLRALGGGLPSFAVLQAAAEWFALLRSGEATDADRARWQAWLSQSAEHEAAWRYVDSVSRRFNLLVQEPRPGAIVETLRAVRGRWSRRRTLAGLGAMLGGSVTGWWMLRDVPAGDWLQALRADHATAVGEIRAMTLSDGTRLWLGSSSAVDVTMTPTLRSVRLRAGEIFVDTARDDRPFIVEERHGLLRALGTRFSVRSALEHAGLDVFDGAVEIRTLRGNAVAVVNAGQGAQYSRDAIGRPSPADRAREAWARGILLAEDVPLRDVVAQLSRYRRGHLGVSDDVAELRVLGGYPLHDTDQALSMLEGVLPVRARQLFPGWVTLEAAPAANSGGD